MIEPERQQSVAPEEEEPDEEIDIVARMRAAIGLVGGSTRHTIAID